MAPLESDAAFVVDAVERKGVSACFRFVFVSRFARAKTPEGSACERERVETNSDCSMGRGFNGTNCKDLLAMMTCIRLRDAVGLALMMCGYCFCDWYG